jgi:hypothetical protein
MFFVFAVLGDVFGVPAWLIRLMVYLTEAVFIAVAIMCVRLAIRSRGGARLRWPDAVAVAGGTSVSLGLIMPFELAPVFFGARGEWMLAGILLIPLYPIAAILLTLAFRKFMKLDRRELGHLPVPERSALRTHNRRGRRIFAPGRKPPSGHDG